MFYKALYEKECKVNKLITSCVPVYHVLANKARSLVESDYPTDRAETILKTYYLNMILKGNEDKSDNKDNRVHDSVNNQSHYTGGDIDVIDFIEDKKLPYHLGNTVKYISRAGKKDPEKTVEDLCKARWYLDRYINQLKKENRPESKPDCSECERVYDDTCSGHRAEQCLGKWKDKDKDDE